MKASKSVFGLPAPVASSPSQGGIAPLEKRLAAPGLAVRDTAAFTSLSQLSAAGLAEMAEPKPQGKSPVGLGAATCLQLLSSPLLRRS